MLTVGIPEGVDRDLHRLLPDGIALENIPKEPQRSCEFEFWIAPVFKKHAQQAWPFLRGVRVVQSMLAGVDGLRPLLPPDVVLCDARSTRPLPRSGPSLRSSPRSNISLQLYLAGLPLALNAAALMVATFETAVICSFGRCMQKLPSGDAQHALDWKWKRSWYFPAG